MTRMITIQKDLAGYAEIVSKDLLVIRTPRGPVSVELSGSPGAKRLIIAWLSRKTKPKTKE